MGINQFIEDLKEENRKENLSHMPVDSRLANLEQEVKDLKSEMKNLQQTIYEIAQRRLPK
jgi:hypothetical protein